MTPTFSAAVMAGGKSRRMGRDKALLPVPGYDFLWQRQVALLEQLAPERLYWSGFPREGLPSHLEVVTDVTPDTGPLAGICACLEITTSDLLIVLAVDLPLINVPLLRRLLLVCRPGRGVVVRHEGSFEPLAAIYPRRLALKARAHLAAQRLALQDFAGAGVKAGMLVVIEMARQDQALFRNLNCPADLLPPA